MRLFFTLVFCLIIVACGPRSVINPSANSMTFTDSEFNEESIEVFYGSLAIKAGLLLHTKTESAGSDDSSYEISIPEKIETIDQAQNLSQTARREIERIDEFFKKYNGRFRLRYKDGDIKIMSLTENAVKRLEGIKTAWCQAVKELENKEILTRRLLI